MGKRRRMGKRVRLECGGCGAKLEATPAMARLVGYRIPGGDVVTLVCNAECERKLYSAARFVNFFVNLDATAAHSDAVLRHDLWLEHGGVRVRKGKIEYVDLGDKLLPPE